jgi:hypothetical protein
MTGIEIPFSTLRTASWTSSLAQISASNTETYQQFIYSLYKYTTAL